MKATGFEYRHRYAIHTILYVLGFVAPWNYAVRLDPVGPNSHVWGILASDLAQLRVGNIGVAFNVLLAVAIACAFAGAFLRTWGSAYLSMAVVQDGGMHTAATSEVGIVEAGPFRYVRNPLYLGTFLNTLALALLMPPSGAIFTIVTIGILQVRLILAEEPFLEARLGGAYVAYCRLVPRMWPSVRPRIAGDASLVPRWGQALLGESYVWCVAIAFAVFGWRYSAVLLVQCVVVAFGISLVVRALAPVDSVE